MEKLLPTASCITGPETPSRNLQHSQHSVIKTDSHSYNMPQKRNRQLRGTGYRRSTLAHRNVFVLKPQPALLPNSVNPL